MRTPKPSRGPRWRPATLRDAGWLRESPSNVWAHLDVRGRSALRKCMILPIPPGAASFPVSAAAVPPAPRRQPEPSVIHAAPQPRRRDPLREARMFPAITERDLLARRRGVRLAERTPERESAPRERWYEQPLALGGLLVVAPPVGLAVLWTSERYSREARMALTLMTGLMITLGAAAMFALAFALLR